MKFQKVRYLWLNRAGLRDLDGLVAALPLLEELYVDTFLCLVLTFVMRSGSLQ